MKTRILTIIIALLSLAAGAQASGTYTLELYDGMKPSSLQMNAILALTVNGDLTMEESGSIKTYKRNSTKLFSVNTANATISVPRTVTSDNGFSAYTLNYTASALMSNKYSSIYLTFSITINLQNFPDTNFRTWVKSQSYGSDGILTRPEIVDATSINVNNKSISNILGIEYFTNLTKLDCPKNQLTSLDVWRNTLLSELYCYENKLTSLNVSNNTLLINLDCSSNQLTSLDVSKSTKLAYLDCKGNRLTSLKVSTSASGLTSISCYGNRLSGSSMDAFISSLPKVSNGTLDVRDLSLSTDNSMTYAQIVAAKQKGWTPMMIWPNGNKQEYDGTDAIMISSDKFPDTNFRSWVSSNCDLNHNAYLSVGEIAAVTSINVSGKSIANLKGIEYFTALTNLNCSNNQLTALDVSKNTSLRLIECYKNKLRDTAVDNLISSLPRKSGADLNFYNNETSTGNLMTYDQVQAAKQKGWTPRMMSTVDGSSAWAEYAGSDVVAIDATNFPDANFRTWVTNNCDADKNGYLSPQEIEAVTLINVRSNNIASLTGIEFFTKLTKLFCSNNLLTSLDLSKNTALYWLWCDHNKLKTLDVSKNTALESLYCYNNQLTSLNVSKNTALTDLSCNDNQLTSLDASKNTALINLNCERNQLTSLLVSTNHKSMQVLCCYGNNLRGTAMADLVNSMPTLTVNDINPNYFFVCNNLTNDNVITTIQVEAAQQKGWRVATTDGNVYPGSDAIAIDASNFPDANFRKWLLEQSYGKDGYLSPAEIAGVKSINVKEMGIASLKGIEFFTALTELYCDDNKLASLDVSKNTVLADLWCFNNQIRGKEMTDLVNSLRDWNSASEGGNLYVYKNETATGNAMTVVQVQTALEKGWAVFYWNDAMDAWVPYFGEVSNGDANGDDKVTAEDVETIRNYILGIVPSSFVFEAADMNGDGTVDIVDLTKLIKNLTE